MYRLKIREIAEQQKLSRTRLSHLAVVDIKAIRRIFNNPQESVSLPVLDRIAQALHVPIQDLIESVYDEPHKEESVPDVL